MKDIYNYLNGKKELTTEEKSVALNELNKEGQQVREANESLLLAMRKDELDIARVLISIGAKIENLDVSLSKPKNLSDTENLIQCYIKTMKDYKKEELFRSCFFGGFIGWSVGTILGATLLGVGVVSQATAFSYPFIFLCLTAFALFWYYRLTAPTYEDRLNYCMSKGIITRDEYNNLSENGGLKVDVHSNEPKSTSTAAKQASVLAKKVKDIYDYLNGKKELTTEEKSVALNELNKEGQQVREANESLLLAMRKDELDIARVLISIGAKIKNLDISLSKPKNLSDTENLIQCYIKTRRDYTGEINFRSCFLGGFIGWIVGVVFGSGLLGASFISQATAFSFPFIFLVLTGFALYTYYRLTAPTYEDRLNYCMSKGIISRDEYNNLSKNLGLKVDVHSNEPKSTSTAAKQASVLAKNEDSEELKKYLGNKKK